MYDTQHRPTKKKWKMKEKEGGKLEENEQDTRETEGEKRA